MALPYRPRLGTPSRRRTTVSSPALRHAHDMLQTQQQAIANLQAQMAAMVPVNAAPAPRVATSSAPEKCDIEMSSAAFRTWRRSMECWIHLNRWPDLEAAMHIRLTCVPALQRALDARFSSAQWSAFSPRQALDSIETLVLRSSNQAVLWSEFFSDSQAPNEPMSAYFQRCSQLALDCAFQCPNCNSDLSEYMSLRKLIVGLSNPVLKREVFQNYHVYNNVDILRAQCTAFEAAVRDADGGGKFCSQNSPAQVAMATTPTNTAEEPPAVAATRQPPRTPPAKPCGNCGGSHVNRGTCPAVGVTCHGCQKVGHFRKYCRSKRKASSAEVSGTVVVASTASPPQPLLAVSVSLPSGGAVLPTMAVADTGAQVCVAGVSLLRSLQVHPAQLRTRQGLRDVAGLHLRCLGSTECRITLDGMSSVQDVYFVESASHLYLSLATCKGLGLVPDSFPHHLPTTATVTAEEVNCPPRPPTMPFPPLDENVPRLQEWFLRHFSSTTFNTTRSPLPVMSGPPHHIHLAPGSRPHACHTPAAVPRHWEAEVKAQLDEDVRRGIIQPVPPGEATEWCARMVVVAKKDGHPRRTVDYQRLNACCLRETHHTPAPFDMVSGVPIHSYKTVADAFWGFHQVELDVGSRKLTTFITPWGRYQYRRTPMGHCSASDAYTRRFDDAIQDVPRKYKCVDDTLLHDISVEQAFWHTYDFLVTCAQSGITLKPEKFSFCRREVDFVGFHLGWESYEPTSERLSAIREFPMPSHPTITDIRSWHGFVNQLAPFLATAPIMEPFRELLKKPTGKQVYWDGQLQLKFRQAQDTICRLAKDGLVYYDKTRPTAAITDWSREGIGFIILQQYCKCTSADTPFCCKGGWRLALCGSRHLTPAEAGYAAVEGEALAVVWCLRKARLFLLGCPSLVLVTDHRPLVKLLGDRALTDVVNPRLFRLKEKTLQYRFTVKYLPGKKNSAADFLSRYPALRAPPNTEDIDQEDDLAAATTMATVAALSQEDGITMDEGSVLEAAAGDPVYQLLVARVLAGDWHPVRAQELACLRPYYGVRDRLAVAQGLVTYTYEQGCVRLVIPESLRHRIAANLHAGHQGLDSMLRRARQTVYWPGMEGDLRHHRSTCVTCDTHTPSSPPEALLTAPPPEYPFQQTVVDLFQLEGHMYLVYADRLTGWLEVTHFPSGTSSCKIISKLRGFFTRWGAPEQLSTDGGTNLGSGEMLAFLEKWGVSVRLSSAHYPQSNGRAEAAVKSAKRIIRTNTGADGSLDTDKTSQALLQYLNTPLRDILKSPAQLATGRQLRDGVPTARQNYKIDRHWRRSLRHRELQMALAKDTPPQTPGQVTRQLEPLPLGSRVRIQDTSTRLWDRSGVVMVSHPHRQYTIRLDGSGRLSLRNRKHLKCIRVTPPTTSLTGSAGPCSPPAAGTPAGARPPAAARPSPVQQIPTAPPQCVRSHRPRKPPQWLNDYI